MIFLTILTLMIYIPLIIMIRIISVIFPKNPIIILVSIIFHPLIIFIQNSFNNNSQQILNSKLNLNYNENIDNCDLKFFEYTIDIPQSILNEIQSLIPLKRPPNPFNLDNNKQLTIDYNNNDDLSSENIEPFNKRN